MSIADQIYVNNLQEIIKRGIWQEEKNLYWPDGKRVCTLSTFCIVNEYNLAEEFPILTIKKTDLHKCINEILWIWQKKSNDITDLEGHMWDCLADKEGKIGKAYGYQLGIKDKYPEGEFDQVDRLLYLLKNDPASRRMIANMYVHKDLHETNIYPCAYSLTLGLEGDRLNGILNQRSQEMLQSNNWNVCQYTALLMMFAYACGFKPGRLLHVIATAIVYDRHLPVLQAIAKLEQHEAPTLSVNVKDDFYKYTASDFQLKEYRYNDIQFNIPRPILKNG